MNEECKDLSGQHLLSVMALVPCIKCLALLPSLYSVSRIWLLVKNVFDKIYVSSFHRAALLSLSCSHFRLREDANHDDEIEN